jgi:hypothetical protein
MGELARVAAMLGGIYIVFYVVLAALRTTVLPRSDVVLLTRWVFRAVHFIFRIRIKGAKDYVELDRRMAPYAPISLVMLPWTWVTGVAIGFTAIDWGLHVDPLRHAFTLSAVSLTTLGSVSAPDLPTIVVSVVEATLGLGLVALLISYLPSIYSAFQRRELQVARLATRAGDPPSAIVMIKRHHALDRLDALDDMWDDYETWFSDIEETHSSQPSLVFFRSISHQRSWITAAGVVLDSAALRASTLDLPREPRAELCIRAGYLSLRRIADYFSIPHDAAPNPTDAISIDRSEFDAAYDALVAEGVPVRPDRDQCWLDFAGWRVNYDQVLITLAGLTNAPYAEWSSDRSIPYLAPLLNRDWRHRRGYS